MRRVVPLSLSRGVVTAIAERHEGLVRIEVDGSPCVAYPELTGPVALGDEVVVNVQARELGLGSGGFDVLLCNLTRGLGLAPAAGAHVMKLPYTPLQLAAGHLEEQAQLLETLGGKPVVCCTLHSQLAPVCAGLGDGLTIAYVQLPGGALPVALSDTVRSLCARFSLQTASVGACFGGDVEAVTVASALAWGAGWADAIVCGIGPGIVGTASRWGHGALAAAEAAHVAAALAGSPILAARASEADPRERHAGVSHHTRAVLDLGPDALVAAWPEGRPAPVWLEPREEVDASRWREACAGLPLSHMGRGPDEDPVFFEAAYAAGVLARARLGARR
jgi:Protein of unknown function (DUF3866)